MNIEQTIEILEALASGCSPESGEILPHDSVLNNRDVIRALQIAIDRLTPNARKKVSERKLKDDRYKEIGYFRQEKFNRLNDEAISRLKERINDIQLQKTDNLSESIVQARVLYPRAYEPWSDEEKELFTKAIEYTNDLEILSVCFQRGKGSLETYGQKIIFETQQNGN